MDDNLLWEINWIKRNQKRYDSPLHATAVIGNIKKRYWIDKARRIALKVADGDMDSKSLVDHCVTAII